MSFNTRRKDERVLRAVDTQEPIFDSTSRSVPDFYLIVCEREVDLAGEQDVGFPYVTINEEENCPADAERVNTLFALEEPSEVSHPNPLDTDLTPPSRLLTVYESECTVYGNATAFEVGLDESGTPFTCASATL